MEISNAAFDMCNYYVSIKKKKKKVGTGKVIVKSLAGLIFCDFDLSRAEIQLYYLKFCFKFCMQVLVRSQPRGPLVLSDL